MKLYRIEVNALEAGYLLAFLANNADLLVMRRVIRQLSELALRVKREEEVRTTILPDGQVSMMEKHGHKIVRPREPWEDERTGEIDVAWVDKILDRGA